MNHLERLAPSPSASWYALRGGPAAVDRYVVSTPSSRAIVNQPEVLGVDFNLRMQDAMTRALRTAPFRPLIESSPASQVCVVNFLRGGLNFELRRALHAAYGFNTASSAFMSSQRYRQDGRWKVKEDMYRKLDIPRGAVLVMGDVVATGVTMANGLQTIIDHVADTGSSIRALVFFTLGCHKAEKVLEELHERLSGLFPEYEKTVLIYLEGKFKLVDSKAELRIGIPGTDLIRRGALLAPELERSGNVSHLLERCAIYDAGSRAFDIPVYVEDVVEYWTELGDLAAGGWTLREATEERAPEVFWDRDRYMEAKRAQWRGLEDEAFEALYTRVAALRHMEQTAGSEALAAICRDRISTLRGVGVSAHP